MQKTIELIESRFRELQLTDPAILGSATFKDLERRTLAVLDSCVKDLPASQADRLRREYFGAGPLESLLDREDITEIIVNGRDSIWIESLGRLKKHDDEFLSDLTFQNFVQRVSREAKLQATLDRPFADGQWQKFRVHLAIPPAAQTSIVTLRKHPTNPWRLSRFAENNWASDAALSALKDLVSERKNFLIVGCTGSGKTSVLNACLQELRDDERAVIIEDTSELHAPNEISTKLLTRRDSNGILTEVDQTELLKQSLRMRPDRIVMGEIRGNEAKDLLMAFATGHSGCMGTMHAESARQALLRLEMLIQLGAAQWSLHAVRSLIFLSLHAIVVVKRGKDGARYLDGIYKITSLEDVGFLLEKII